jgi:hypothetical protein
MGERSAADSPDSFLSVILVTPVFHCFDGAIDVRVFRRIVFLRVLEIVFELIATNWTVRNNLSVRVASQFWFGNRATASILKYIKRVSFGKNLDQRLHNLFTIPPHPRNTIRVIFDSTLRAWSIWISHTTFAFRSADMFLATCFFVAFETSFRVTGNVVVVARVYESTRQIVTRSPTLFLILDDLCEHARFRDIVPRFVVAPDRVRVRFTWICRDVSDHTRVRLNHLLVSPLIVTVRAVGNSSVGRRVPMFVSEIT